MQNWRGDLPSCYGGGEKGHKKMVDPKPKFLNVGEEQFWRARFDPTKLLTLQEIASLIEVDPKSFRSAVGKLDWNLKHGFHTNQTTDLITLAAQSTEVSLENNPYLLTELVVRRAQQVNWERRHRKPQPWE